MKIILHIRMVRSDCNNDCDLSVYLGSQAQADPELPCRDQVFVRVYCDTVCRLVRSVFASNL